jgi:2-C-methyl-D-erythritol 4-phosphate cytidylyltransferase/2-C-methyl-D-erythritol 2,4-cyclodiphosphate synthase
MGKTGAVIVAAGSGKRMGTALSKQYLPLLGKPIVVHALEAFERSEVVHAAALVVGADDEEYGRELVRRYGLSKVVRVVAGGAERQHSVKRGLDAIVEALPGVEWVLVHDGARPLITPEVIARSLGEAKETGAAIPAVPVKDTIKVADRSLCVAATPERQSLWAVQTPQAFRVEVLARAHEQAVAEGFLGTDDAMLAERIGVKVRIAEGDYRNVKVTTPEDLGLAERLLLERDGEDGGTMFRVGQGFDVHRFAEGRPCIIGGVAIPHERGLLGHSDADVLLHAVADAVLGALGLGDIGKHFPDTDPAFKDADSMKLLQHVWGLVRERGYKLGNLDCTIIAQRPKMAPHIPAMVEGIARTLEAEADRVNVKATTTEQLGFPGREEGIAAQAVVCLVRG